MGRIVECRTIRVVVLMLVVAVGMSLVAISDVNAGEYSNGIYQYPEKKALPGGYYFKFQCDENGTRAYVYRNNRIVAKRVFNDPYQIMNFTYVKRINGKHYFNCWRTYGAGIVGIYTWKPGETTFKKVKSKVLLDNKKHIGKYWAAYWDYLPSDTSFMNMCLYDTKKNKRISLGKRVDAIKPIGKKFYYCKFNKDGDKVTIMSCSKNGKNKKILKVRKLKNKKGTPSWEKETFMGVKKMTKHYVVLSFQQAGRGNMKIKYR